ncbi:MAG: PAS domain-containing protein [Polyangiaceae bacterium]|nr:PAS domain-containing protein [Polyangiaceae bacterium]
MDDRRFAALLAYVGFDASASERLRELHAVAGDALGELVDDFQATVLAHDPARAVVTGGEAQLTRMHGALARWLDSLLLGPQDSAWARSYARTGDTHVRVGLPQELLPAAVSRLRAGLVSLVDARVAPERRAATLAAVHQILDASLAVLMDSYREHLLARIRDSERREVAEFVPAFVLALDAGGHITLWNGLLERVTGRSREEMVGQPGRDLIRCQGDRALPVAGGGHRIVRWECGPPGPDGVTYAIGVDVTEEKALQRRSSRAERLAAVGTLAAGLAHEVRNPLNSASLQLQVLRRKLNRGDPEPAALLPTVDRVAAELERIDALVRDFLAFAQPRPLALARVAVGEALDLAVQAIRPAAAAAGVEVRVERLGDAGTVDAEPGRLVQVLVALAHNGIEAMPEGGILTLRSAGPDADGNVHLEVEDTGVGFAEDAPVFDAFYTTKPAGTGLGLALVHRIVSEHGGSVGASSRPGRTCFTVVLPASTDRPPAGAEQAGTSG